MQHEDAPSEPRTPAPEADPRLPSGEWIGFFQQRSMSQAKGWMELILAFAEGKVQGEGRDGVGEFVIAGSYDLARERVWLHKRYLGKHDVAYEGFAELGRGIWGRWFIRIANDKGGFHIWPKGMADPTGSTLHASAELPNEEEVAALINELATLPN